MTMRQSWDCVCPTVEIQLNGQWATNTFTAVLPREGTTFEQQSPTAHDITAQKNLGKGEKSKETKTPTSGMRKRSNGKNTIWSGSE